MENTCQICSTDNNKASVVALQPAADKIKSLSATGGQRPCKPPQWHHYWGIPCLRNLLLAIYVSPRDIQDQDLLVCCCSFPCCTAGCCHLSSELTDRGISQWPPASEELGQLPFLLLSKNLSVFCLLHHVRGSVQTFMDTIIFLLKFCLSWWSSYMTLLAFLLRRCTEEVTAHNHCHSWQTHVKQSEQPALRRCVLPSSGHCPLYTKYIACSLWRLDTHTSPNSTIKQGSALPCFHSQLPKREHKYGIAVAVLRHKLHPGLAVTLSNKAASGNTVQLRKIGQACQGASPNTPTV